MLQMIPHVRVFSSFAINNVHVVIQAAKNIESIPRLSLKARCILKGHSQKVSALAWAEDRKHLVSASQDSRLIVWNAPYCLKEHAIHLKCAYVMTCAYSPSGTLVASGGLDNTLSLYNVKRPEPEKTLQALSGHEGYISCCKFLDDRRVLTSSGDRTVCLWDINTGTPLHKFRGHRSDVMRSAPLAVSRFSDSLGSISISPDHNTFVSGGCDSTARLFDIRTEKCLHTFTGHKLDINAVQSVVCLFTKHPSSGSSLSDFSQTATPLGQGQTTPRVACLISGRSISE